ncbi:uncharacterized protein LOC129224635 [Uloborus diversus]|uniref:uncharacterized protein LOC129224635 n=1 Tax=Uloborus diversus TaxID=327109 RepID=UPI002408FFBB|nr:uncharacterized protein LOC129224635 [Uloborus diversus]
MQCSDDDDDVDARHFLRLYFEKESEKADHKWKLRSVTVNEIIFEVMLGQIYIHVPRESSGCVAGNGSNITFTYDTSDTFMDPSISELGYKLFTSHVTDTFIQLPLSPKDVVEKLQSYLKIAPIGRLFMRDIDHVSTAHDFSSSMSDDILRFSVDDVLNRNHNMKFRMIFPVNMKTYPNEKIIPDVEFIFNFCSVKKEDILCCVESIEPGEDYLYRMVQEARYFKK